MNMTQQTDHVPDGRKKVTAVEWLIERVNHKSWNDIMIDIPKDIIQQAKAMHKQEIKDAHTCGRFNIDNITSEQYYIETYGQ